jgi:hypothetical protein
MRRPLSDVRSRKDVNTDGTTPSNHLHRPIRRMSESMTSSIEMNTASMTVGSTSIALRSDAGCLGKDRVGKSSHYSDARRSVDSHRSMPGPVIDESAPVTSTPKNHRRADSLRRRLHRRPHNFKKPMSLELVRTRDTEGTLPRHDFTGARHKLRSRKRSSWGMLTITPHPTKRAG